MEEISRDRIWKGIVVRQFFHVLDLCVPELGALADRSRAPVFLDKVLESILREDMNDRREADLLVQFWRLDGTEQWVLFHIEIQGYDDAMFPKRMFVYGYRAIELLKFEEDAPFVACALLTDENANFHPKSFTKEHFGTKFQYDFNTLKLWEFGKRRIKNKDNPFAWALRAAYVCMKRHRHEDLKLMRILLAIVRELYRRKFSRAEIRQVLLLIRKSVRFSDPNVLPKFVAKIEQINDYHMEYRSLGIEEIWAEEQRAEGMAEGIKESATRLLRNNFTSEDVSRFLEIDLVLVLQLKAKLDATEPRLS